MRNGSPQAVTELTAPAGKKGKPMKRRYKAFHQFGGWVTSFVRIADSVVAIVTLGFYYPWWAFRATAWFQVKLLKMRMKGEADG